MPTPINYIRTASVSGYYLMPPAFVGEDFDPNNPYCRTVGNMLATAYETRIGQGIRVRVRRDGLILFDFEGNSELRSTYIPQFNVEPGGAVPTATTSAEEKCERRLISRSRILNVHQACIMTAYVQMRRKHVSIGEYISPFCMVELERMEDNPSQFGISSIDTVGMAIENAHQEVLRKDWNALQRRKVVEQNVIQRSFVLLHELLHESNKEVLAVTELIFLSSLRFREHRFEESLVHCWTSIEVMLSNIWETYLRGIREHSPERINNDRMQKLMGTDITASLVLEFLEFSDLIDLELYKQVNKIRKVRNNWLHEAKGVSKDNAQMAFFVANELHTKSYGLSLHLGLTGFGAGGGTTVNVSEVPPDRR